MKQLIITIAALLLLPLAVMAQYEEDTENGVVSLNGKEGFTIATKKGDFVFKPYMLVQTSANINYYDDEGLDPAYNQDNIHNSGFSIPYAILGFTGKAFDRVTFNLSINAAGNGGNILQQAWFDVEIKKSFAIRVGKFKTPFSHAYLTTLGETLMPTLPTSLTSSVILPYSLNAVTPNIGMGFDLGVEVHGLVKEKFGSLRPMACANLPYYITSPILTALLEAECFRSVTVMVQKEVAQRIAAKPGTPDYGAFTVFCQYYAQPELLFDVPAHCFLPQPKVTSAVITLRTRQERPWEIADEAVFFRAVRASFAMRRKKLSNGLSSGFPELGKAGAEAVIAAAGFDANVRGETLGIPEFARIANEIVRQREGMRS